MGISRAVRTILLALTTVIALHISGLAGSMETIEASAERLQCPNVQCEGIDSCEHQNGMVCCVAADGSECLTRSCPNECPPD